MRTKEGTELEIRRLGHSEVDDIQRLMTEVISRLPDQELFAMDDEAYLHAHIQEKGEIHGAFDEGRLVAYCVLAYPGSVEGNLGREFGVPEEELPYVGVLDSTVIHESVRGLGLQRYFLDLREKQAREKGCLYLYSTVHPENVPSKRNLEAAGFIRQFTRPMYGGKTRHCYVKRLSTLEA